MYGFGAFASFWGRATVGVLSLAASSADAQADQSEKGAPKKKKPVGLGSTSHGALDIRGRSENPYCPTISGASPVLRVILKSAPARASLP